MLHGVGGSTIAEAKANLSFIEAQAWFKYLAKRGSLNLGRRIESAAALLVTTYLRAKGNRDVTMFDFMPHEDEPVAGIDDIVKAFGAIATGS